MSLVRCVIFFSNSAYSRKMIHEYELFYRDAKVSVTVFQHYSLVKPINFYMYRVG